MSFLDRIQRLLSHFPWLGYLVAAVAVIGVALLIGFGGGFFWLLAFFIAVAGLVLLTLTGAWHMLVRLIFPASVRPPPIPEPTPQMKQAALVQSLPAEEQARHGRLRTVCAQLAALGGTAADRVTTASFGAGLQHLEWTHLKLLLTRQDLLRMQAPQTEMELRSRLNALRESADLSSLTPAARASLEGAISLTEEQLQHLSAHGSRLVETDAELTRIEAELDLALQRARLDPSAASAGLTARLAADHVRTAEWRDIRPAAVKELDEWHTKSMQSDC